MIVSDSAFDTAKAFADFFVGWAKENNSENKKLYVALSGGSTPKILFDLLAKNYASEVNWENVVFYWGDERMVSETDPESNYGEAKRLLFDNINIPEENIIPVNGNNTLESEAKAYSRKIENILPSSMGIPVFDLIILGMGDDGHTASIFPNQIELFDSEKICVVAEHPVTGQKRISITGKVINNAQKIVFLITGTTKSKVLDTIINKRDDYLKYPASHVTPANGELLFFLDQEAAIHLM